MSNVRNRRLLPESRTSGLTRIAGFTQAVIPSAFASYDPDRKFTVAILNFGFAPQSSLRFRCREERVEAIEIGDVSHLELRDLFQACAGEKAKKPFGQFPADDLNKFNDLCNLERAKGIEPSTISLGS
jgi:hypothetical protein